MKEEITGIIKTIYKTQTYGENGFRKRELVITTKEQYPQMILIEFIQDKCELLDKHDEDQEVTIQFNLRGREWINPEGIAKYFNAIQGWRIESINADQQTEKIEQIPETPTVSLDTADNLDDGLPF